MYCSPEEYKEVHYIAGESCDYGTMRNDISYTLFNGVADFSFSSLLVESASSTSNSTGGFEKGSGSGGGGVD